MNYFIIGDVHGCYYTFKNMLDKQWNHENELLIQLGDLINQGLHSPKMVQFAMELSEHFNRTVVFLKGTMNSKSLSIIQMDLIQIGSDNVVK